MFGLDAAGAAVSALLLVVLIAPNAGWFGMPGNVARALAFPAVALAIYSGSCYFSQPLQWRRHLRRIALTNLLYCFAIIAFLISYRELIRPLGYAYFAAECGIIALLVSLELRILKTRSNP